MGECSSTPLHFRSHGPPPSRKAGKQLCWYILIRPQANPPKPPPLKSGLHPRASTQNLKEQTKEDLIHSFIHWLVLCLTRLYHVFCWLTDLYIVAHSL